MKKISLKAKGLLALLLSYPDNWQFYEAEIVQHAADKANSLSSGLKELIENGYIVRKLGKDETGKFKGYEYHIYEKPITEKTDNGKTDNGKSDNGKTDNGKTDNGKSDNGKSDNGKSDNGKSGNY